MDKFWEQIHCGDNVTEVVRDEHCIIMKMQDESGEGTMSVYEVFPGVSLIFNDFHMKECTSQFQTGSDILCMDHCREGCMEQQVGESIYSYLEKGDLKIDNREYHSGKVTFPVRHYHGMSIGFYLPTATVSLKEELKDFSVDLLEIKQKYCNYAKPYVLKSEEKMNHIFLELYHVPKQIRKDYYRIKIFELLLYLDALKIDNCKEERPYFYKSQVEKIKAIHSLMTKDITRFYTIDELTKLFHVSQTALKNCFKTVYGNTIYAYMKNYRMNTAASMLVMDREKSVSEIAGLVGYDTPSKFAAAFKKEMSMTPMEYRNSMNK